MASTEAGKMSTDNFLLVQRILSGGFSKAQVVGTALTLLLTIFVLNAFYNLYLHPLAGVPGPRLAAITEWWSHYYELRRILPHKCTEIVESLQSSTIRVGPNRVIVHDVSQYDIIYRSGSKFGKDPVFYHALPSASEGSTTVTATNKQVHAERRKMLASKLSRQNITSIENMVAEKLNKVTDIFSRAAEEHKSINIFSAWRSFTLDVISTFAFGHCMDGLERPNLDHEMLNTLNIAMLGFYKFARVPLVARLLTLKSIAPYLASVSSDVASMASFKIWARECVDAYVPETNVRYLFDALFNPPSDGRKLTKDEIQTEAEEMIIAGSDTTATTLTVALVHLAQQPEIWEKLNQELLPVVPDPTSIPAWASLENLPLLSACVKEALRIASPIPGYLWRIVPSEGMTTPSGHFLPGNTAVGMCAQAMHNDARIFPQPQKFNPSRWLGDNGPELSRYLVPFSKGSRQCAGINMAYMELYTALAVTCRRFIIRSPPPPFKPMRILESFVGILEDDEWPIYFEPRKD